jgi:hypothetical protein
MARYPDCVPITTVDQFELAETTWAAVLKAPESPIMAGHPEAIALASSRVSVVSVPPPTWAPESVTDPGITIRRLGPRLEIDFRIR